MVTGALEGPQQISKKPLSLWKTRNYLLLWAGSGVSIVGSRATSVAYPLLVLAVTGSPAMAGWVAFTRLLPDVLFYIPAGPFVDRWHWRRTMLATEVGRGLAVGTIGLALLFGNLGVVHIFIVALVEGTLGVFYRLSEPVAVKSVVHKDQLPSALASNETRTHSAVMLGRSLGGFLFGLGRAVPFVADALSFVLSFGAVAFMTGAPAAASVRSKDEDRSVRREILEGVRWVIENPFLRTDIVITVGLGISVHGLILAFTVNAQRFEVSPLWIGLTLATPGVGGVIGSAFAAWAYRKLGLSLIFIQTWLWAAIFVIPLFGVGVESIAVTLFIIGLIGSVGNVAVSTYTVQQAPHEMLGRVSSVGLMVMFGGTALGSLIGGLLITAIGVDGTVRILFALMMILASWATTVRAFRSPASLERLS